MTTAIILAGGLGTRLRETVSNLPKPMAPIHGRPFLEHQMNYWLAQGVKSFIISVGYLHDTIINHFGDSYKNIPVSYAIEESPLGTGGGFLLAAQKLTNDMPFLVLNGDTFFEASLPSLIDFHEQKTSDWTFALTRSNEVGRYMGMDVAEENTVNAGKILSLKSGTAQIGRLINSGVYLVNPAVLHQFDDDIGSKLSLEDDIFPCIVDGGARIYGIEFKGDFIDIGVPDDYFRADKILPS
ncbi:MAG TPA: nucleotidyltransferase family protein [Methylobacter sp.]|jgi:D-glycero-alpha-D-manno-heptose 1-phosphate guanylyltransferase